MSESQKFDRSSISNIRILLIQSYGDTIERILIAEKGLNLDNLNDFKSILESFETTLRLYEQQSLEELFTDIIEDVEDQAARYQFICIITYCNQIHSKKGFKESLISNLKQYKGTQNDDLLRIAIDELRKVLNKYETESKL
jgi:hypothetical protein